MEKEKIITAIKETGVMAVVRVETIERGIEIAQGCLEGGVNVLEISYTNANAGLLPLTLRYSRCATSIKFHMLQGVPLIPKC